MNLSPCFLEDLCLRSFPFPIISPVVEPENYGGLARECPHPESGAPVHLTLFHILLWLGRTEEGSRGLPFPVPAPLPPPGAAEGFLTFGQDLGKKWPEVLMGNGRERGRSGGHWGSSSPPDV